MLGIGGVRVLRQLGIQPDMWHMNEGHSAFLVLECIREKVAQGMSFETAAAEVKASSLFTTHTPVPAGHDAFPFHMMEHYFAGYWDELGLNRDQFFELGKHEEEWGTAFNMTVLALRMSGQANGVSKLHGQISRNMWQNVWPDKAPEDTPITHVTNGIHLPTWLPSEASDLYRKYFGPNWMEFHDDPAIWQRIDDIPDEELWELHQGLKRKMVSFFRERVRRSWIEGRNDPTHIVTSGTMLDPDALTIGFARRFATYKRALLIFRDLERLKRIVSDDHRPVQIIFAGKAHPADDPGKHLIQNIFNLAKHNQLGGRIAFIEDYDMHMARYMVQGVDVWLNTPRRPREASGTSGQKAALNGIPNLRAGARRRSGHQAEHEPGRAQAVGPGDELPGERKHSHRPRPGCQKRGPAPGSPQFWRHHADRSERTAARTGDVPGDARAAGRRGAIGSKFKFESSRLCVTAKRAACWAARRAIARPCSRTWPVRSS
jgi:starch phosphorylase